MSDRAVIYATQTWLASFIIAYNICPFAKREQQRNSIRYHVTRPEDLPGALEAVITECEYLDSHAETETTLVIFPDLFADFEDYLDLLALAEQLLQDQGYAGTYQLASFHPDYRFESATPDIEDAADYTNRSPYPMLHIIRETSIDRALATYPDPENIPARNIQLTRELGLEKLKALLASCYATPE